MKTKIKIAITAILTITLALTAYQIYTQNTPAFPQILTITEKHRINLKPIWELNDVNDSERIVQTINLYKSGDQDNNEILYRENYWESRDYSILSYPVNTTICLITKWSDNSWMISYFTLNDTEFIETRGVNGMQIGEVFSIEKQILH